MKKIFALLLTLAMVLALAACGSQPANDPAPAPSDGGQTDTPAPPSAPEKIGRASCRERVLIQV